MRHLHSVAFRNVVIFLFVLVSAVAFVNGIPSKQTSLSRARKAVTGTKLKLKVADHLHSASIVAAASAVAAPSTVGTIVAKALGYVIGAGSLAVYLPIVFSLWKKKSADGFSSVAAAVALGGASEVGDASALRNSSFSALRFLIRSSYLETSSSNLFSCWAS